MSFGAVGGGARLIERPLVAGDRLGGLTIERQVGQGGMGAVYKARDQTLNRDAAVKVLNDAALYSGEFGRARLLEEAKMAGKLSHPHIVAVYDVSRDAGRAFIAMEWVDGSTLGALVPEGGLPLARVLAWGAQIARGLAHAHGQGLIHRDVKPGNVMIDDRGAAKLLDFGLATLRDGHSSGEASVVGTVPFMSPEQAQGQALDARADMFSFGAVLYQMTTGRRPFEGDSPTATLAAICSAEPSPVTALRPEAPGPLADLILRCLAKNPADRFDSMTAVADGLAELSAAMAEPRRRFRFLRWAPLAAVIALAAAIWLLVTPGRSPVRALATQTFASIGGDPALDLLAKGFSEDFHLGLALAAGARDDAWPVSRARGRSLGARTAQSLNEVLGATHVFTGSVEDLGASIRLNLALVDARTAVQIGGVRVEAPDGQLWLLRRRALVAAAELLVWAADEETHAAWKPADYRDYLYGLAYLAEDQPAWHGEALDLFEAIARRQPENVLVHIGLARARMALDRAEGTALPSDLTADDGLAMAELRYLSGLWKLEQGDDPAALDAFAGVLAAAPARLDAQVGRALALRRMGRHEEAAEACRAAVRRAPNYWGAWAEMAEIERARGRYRQAREISERLIAAVPANAAGYWLAASVAQDLGRPEEGEQWRQRAMAAGAVWRKPDPLLP